MVLAVDRSQLSLPSACKFRAEVHRRNNLCVLRLAGALVEPLGPDLEDVRNELEGPCHSMLIDASLLGDIDQGGIGLLQGLRDRIDSGGGTMHIYAATGEVARALDGSGLLT
jgi:anti-anti-sigma regulatory factor